MPHFFFRVYMAEVGASRLDIPSVLQIIYPKNTKLPKIIVKAQINPIIRILIKTTNLFIIIVQ